MDILIDATSKLAEELLPEEKSKPNDYVSKRLNLYPAHFKLKKVQEPINGSELFFIEAGDVTKRPLLLVHGLGDLASIDWLNVIPSLEKDYHVFAIDLPGFGLSENKYFEFSPEQYSRVIHWFTQTVMSQTSQQPTLIGHSMGGAVSLYYAERYPETIDRLILVSAAGILERTSYLKHLSKLPNGDTPLNDIWLGFSRRIDHFSAKWVEKTGEIYDPTQLFKKSKALRRLMLKENPNLNAALALMDTNFSHLNFDQ
ncbi:MAG: alpha/beta fold hydrolase, partial [Kangiellaceae bacterium]